MVVDQDCLSDHIIQDGTLIIPEGATKIAAHAFKDNQHISEVLILATMTEIGDYAFSGVIFLI